MDNLFGHFLIDSATVLYNLSITSGKFPDSCKMTKLKPIYKRSISLLPLISKVIEKVIHDHSSAFLNSRNSLCNYQSGFPKNHSADFCLSFLNDKILKGFDQSLITRMILIVLQKAFWYKRPWLFTTKIVCYWFL